MRAMIRATLVALSGLALHALGCAQEDTSVTGSSESVSSSVSASSSSSSSSGSGGAGGTGGQGGSGGAPCVPEAEICDGMDNNCDMIVDEGCDCYPPGTTEACYNGPPGTEGVGVCVGGQRTCGATNMWGDCMGAVEPRPEGCNGMDDDCNGMADDALADLTCGVGACKVTIAACTNGAPNECIPTLPSLEICDGLDNDCDQLKDETFPGMNKDCDTGIPGICAPGTNKCVTGVQTCVPNASPKPETCDGIDTDCDGMVDNNIPGTGSSCTTGIPGACSQGMISCQDGKIDCFPIGDATPETCNNLDDNCNGEVDENNPDGGATCVTGIGGACDAGTMTCVNGAVICVADNADLVEICNGIDDQCDGQIDEDNPGGGYYCPTGLMGACADGVTNCENGMLKCNAYVTPIPEICNGIDDDCNGMIDQNNPGGGVVCNTGVPGICDPGHTKCQGGAIVCIPDIPTGPEICGNGLDDDCNGVPDPMTVLAENFSAMGTPAGWTLGTEWEIGPLVTNNCTDPTMDTTAFTTDNRAAGVAIYPSTGCASTVVHTAYYYLTSPVFDATGLSQVILSFKRWLRTDYTPYMNSRLEVYNGTAWVMIWESGAAGLYDTSWKAITHNLTMHKNATMQIRWGFNVGSSGAFSVGQWTIDDVYVADAVCN